jgi:hypothetical protein
VRLSSLLPATHTGAPTLKQKERPPRRTASIVKT